ncbi:hypothetical protein TNCT_201051 [Trichonephila clavata]|uniref:Uncharacterized protein n=1 Tax=Trichonephila clavata TaxID=2740835 RepID=A0A8X6JBK9_TRICU|nr:hypothetical protein TNCT_201051 [Trichonephila clavata]
MYKSPDRRLNSQPTSLHVTNELSVVCLSSNRHHRLIDPVLEADEFLRHLSTTNYKLEMDLPACKRFYVETKSKIVIIGERFSYDALVACVHPWFSYRC